MNTAKQLLQYELFHFIKFKDFLRENDAFISAIAIIIATQIKNFADSLTENIIIPIFDIDLNKDGVRDVKKIEDYEFEIIGIKFKIGKLIVEIMKFVITLYIIYLVSKLGFDKKKEN